MKKRDQQLLMLAGLAAGGYFLYSKSKSPTVSGVPGVAGYPGVGMVGATMPSHSIIPESLRGKCSPWYLDAAVWGIAGTALGYYGLAGKKL